MKREQDIHVIWRPSETLYFTTLDTSSGFHQMSPDPDSCEFTTLLYVIVLMSFIENHKCTGDLPEENDVTVGRPPRNKCLN